MYAVEAGGDVVPFAEFQNAHGGAIAVWRVLAERYLAGTPFFELLQGGLKELFALAREGKMEPWETVVLMTTCDNVVLPVEHVESVASAFEEFDRHHGDQQREQSYAFSIPDQARELRRMVEEREEEGWRGVCWNQTSVNGDAPWYGVWEDGEEDESRPYNIDRDDVHWFWPEESKDT